MVAGSARGYPRLNPVRQPSARGREMDQKPDILQLNWNTAGEGHGAGALYLMQSASERTT